MNQKKKPSKQQWILFSLSILMIIYLWSRKDLSAFTQLDAQDTLPVIVTSLCVSLLKIGIIALVVAAGKYILNKFLSKK
jgi:hypothetical protein